MATKAASVHGHGLVSGETWDFVVRVKGIKVSLT
jgi:hypothetical protein